MTPTALPALKSTRILRWIGIHFAGVRGVGRLIRRCHGPERTGMWYVEDVFSTPWGGARFRLRSDFFTEWQTMFFGSQDRSLHEALLQFARPDAVALDIGANFGFFSCVLGIACREVHAFEPVPELAGRLKFNVELNRLENVRIHQHVLGGTDGEIQFHLPSGLDSNNGTGSVVRDNGGRTIAVSARKLDSFVQSEGLQRLDLIKLDVEGAEPEVLAGGQESLTRFRPVVFFENNMGCTFPTAAGDTTRRAMDILTRLGYEIRDLTGRRVVDPPPASDQPNLKAVPI